MPIDKTKLQTSLAKMHAADSDGGAQVTKFELERELPKTPTFQDLFEVRQEIQADQSKNGPASFSPEATAYLDQTYFGSLKKVTPNLPLGRGGVMRLTQAVANWTEMSGGTLKFKTIKTLADVLPPGATPVAVHVSGQGGLDDPKYRYYVVSHEGVPNALVPWNQPDFFSKRKAPMEGFPSAATLVRVSTSGKMQAIPFSAALFDAQVEGKTTTPTGTPLPKPPATLDEAKALLAQPGITTALEAMAKETVRQNFSQLTDAERATLTDRLLPKAKVSITDVQKDVAGGYSIRLQLSRYHDFLGETYPVRDVVVRWSAKETAALSVRNTSPSYTLIEQAWRQALADPKKLG